MSSRPVFLALYRRFRAAGLMVALAGAPAADAAPNVVLILADDLGWGDLGCYGQKEIRTPNLDRLAAEGMRFTQFYAGSSVCAPSRSCLMSGRHNGRGRVRDNVPHGIHLLAGDVPPNSLDVHSYQRREVMSMIFVRTSNR